MIIYTTKITYPLEDGRKLDLIVKRPDRDDTERLEAMRKELETKNKQNQKLRKEHEQKKRRVSRLEKEEERLLKVGRDEDALAKREAINALWEEIEAYEPPDLHETLGDVEAVRKLQFELLIEADPETMQILESVIEERAIKYTELMTDIETYVSEARKKK